MEAGEAGPRSSEGVVSLGKPKLGPLSTELPLARLAPRVELGARRLTGPRGAHYAGGGVVGALLRRAPGSCESWRALGQRGRARRVCGRLTRSLVKLLVEVGVVIAC